MLAHEMLFSLRAGRKADGQAACSRYQMFCLIQVTGCVHGGCEGVLTRQVWFNGLDADRMRDEEVRGQLMERVGDLEAELWAHADARSGPARGACKRCTMPGPGLQEGQARYDATRGVI